ncbi:MAG: ATP-binding protein [Candidatus Cyclobacteriaceae bacterium M2_1C_046]
MEALFKNIGESNLKKLRKKLVDISLNEYKDEHDLKDDTALFIIGEEGTDLIPTIQKISKKDPDLGILVIPAKPFMLNHLKAAIQFAPFIGSNVKIINSIDQPGLKETIKQHSELTIKRKNFRKTKKVSVEDLQSGFKLDGSLKSIFLDNFLSQSPVGVILLDNDNIILDVNKYAVNYLPEIVEYQSKNIFNLFPAHKKEIKKFINHSHPEGDNIVLEIKNTEGDVKFARFYHSIIDSPNTTYNILIFLDITREKESELKNEQYLKELKAHNTELEQFAYIVTHDLKNPLSTISLSCEMSEEGTVEEKNHYLSIISRSAKNLIQMLEGLEVMIDVRRDKEQQTKKLNIATVFAHVLNEYQYQIDSKGIEIKTIFKQKNIQYVESYLFSILHNMISNAIKYSRSGFPLELNIETEQRGKFTLLKISDNGIGIDLEKYGDNLFKPFRRLTQQAEGKGIGLSLIKSMIEKNGGKIEVESAPGEGTTFYCYLCPYV